jgi:hypothetical protein
MDKYNLEIPLHLHVSTNNTTNIYSLLNKQTFQFNDKFFIHLLRGILLNQLIFELKKISSNTLPDPLKIEGLFFTFSEPTKFKYK